jgi:hypothetical protein
MARKIVVLDLPGDGKKLELDLSREEIIKIIRKELQPLISNPLGGNVPPPNKQSTVKRKGKSTPLRDTGLLLDNVFTITDEASVKIYVQKYYFYLKKPYRILLSTSDVKKIVDIARVKISSKLAKFKR